MRIPDYFEPLVGWRSWKVSHSGVLSAAASGNVWYPGIPNRAMCNVANNGVNWGQFGCHPVWDAPYPNCSCGFYCFKDLQGELMQLLEYDSMTYATSSQSLGQVNMWGKIIEHERGHRAQYIYPKALIVGESVGMEAVEIIRKEYRIEVEVVPNLNRFLKQMMQGG